MDQSIWHQVLTQGLGLDSSHGFLLCSEEIVAGSVDGTVRRFDVRAGCLFTDDLGQSVTSIAISGDNLCVLAACLDGYMRLLDKATGTMLAQYTGGLNICLYVLQITQLVNRFGEVCNI